MDDALPARRVPLTVRRWFLAGALALTFDARALVSPCSIPGIGPTEIFTTPNESFFLSGTPIGTCGFRFTTPTPNIVAIDPPTFTPMALIVRITTRAPGEGTVFVSGSLPGGGSYSRLVATVHVDSCEPEAH